jgi:hypothetical protein
MVLSIVIAMLYLVAWYVYHTTVAMLATLTLGAVLALLLGKLDRGSITSDLNEPDSDM